MPYRHCFSTFLWNMLLGRSKKTQEDLKLIETYRLPICTNDVIFLVEENAVVTRG
jgi:hypothetical protein